MTTLMRRISRLEDQFGSANRPRRCTLIVVCNAGWGLALDEDRCIQILGECGFLPTGPAGVVNLGNIPHGLSAEETERFLREHGAEICGLGGAQDPSGPECAVTYASEGLHSGMLSKRQQNRSTRETYDDR